MIRLTAATVTAFAILSLVVDIFGQANKGQTTPPTTATKTAEKHAPTQVASDPKPIFENKEIHLPTGSTHDDVLAKVLIKSRKTAHDPVLTDVSGSEIPGKVEFAYVGQKQVKDTDIILWFRVSVENFPASLSVQRSALLKLDGKEYKLPYTLTNLSGTPQLTVQGPVAPWTLDDSSGSTSVDVISGDASATDLTMSASTTAEKDGRFSIDAKDLRLCATPACDRSCPAPSLPPHSRGSFLLCKFASDSNSGSPFGEFNGKVVISAFEYPAGTATEIKAFSNSPSRKVWGCILLFLGVLSAWLLRTYAANRLTRDQALLGVALERQRVDKLLPTVTALAADFRQQEADIYDYLIDLSANKLTTEYVQTQLYINPEIPLPFQFSPRAAQFSAFLSQIDSSLNLLEIIVGQGLKPVLLLSSSSESNYQQAFQTAVQSLNNLFVQNVPPPVARTRVAAILNNLRTAIAPPNAVAAAAAAPAVEPLPSLSSLLLEIRRLSQATWIAICVLTIMAGWVVLISRNPGFGKDSDLVFCLFWGFGIPVTAQSLLPSSVLNAFVGSTMRVGATV